MLEIKYYDSAIVLYEMKLDLVQGKSFCDCKGPAGFKSSPDHCAGGARWCRSKTERILEFYSTYLNTEVNIVNGGVELW